MSATSLLGRPEDAPLRSRDALASFGRTLVVAPHQDDESLGCGGAIALLRELGHPVHALFVTDGSKSHPTSHRYPAPKLSQLREREALAALATLGVAGEMVTFLRLKDGATPLPGDPAFDAAAMRCRAVIADIGSATILLPWRRDPHPDHRATWTLVDAALATLQPRPRMVQYLIWFWTRAEPGDAPTEHEAGAWRLDIADVLPRKLAAIAAHRSQTTGLIDDDPQGFRLAPEMLALFARPWELYLEAPAHDCYTLEARTHG